MPENIDTARLKPGLRHRARTITVRACTRCGARQTACRCQPLATRDAEYRRNRLIVLSEEFVCHICGQPAKPGDPLEVDHRIARAHGGSNKRTNLRAAHATCNRRAGAAITNAA